MNNFNFMDRIIIPLMAFLMVAVCFWADDCDIKTRVKEQRIMQECSALHPNDYNQINECIQFKRRWEE